MIEVDSQGPETASAIYAKKLEARGLAVELGRLRFGDIRFYGLGPDDAMISVGIEIKGVKEFCSDTLMPRFTGFQVPGMVKTYDYRYLFIKGPYRPDFRTGELVVPFGKEWRPVRVGSHTFSFHEFQTRLTTIIEHAGFTYCNPHTDHELVSLVCTFHTWWYKGFESHGTLRTFYQTKPGGIQAPSRFRAAIRALCGGVGWKRTAAIEALFPNMEALLDATQKELEAVDGIGKKVAAQLYNALRT